MESSLCQHLKNLLKDQEISEQQVKIRLFRANEEKDRITDRISNSKSQIQTARNKSQLSGGLARLGPTGAAAATLSKLESEVRISWLEGELTQLEQKLPRVESEVSSLANELHNLTENAKVTHRQLREEGCT